MHISAIKYEDLILANCTGINDSSEKSIVEGAIGQIVIVIIIAIILIIIIIINTILIKLCISKNKGILHLGT